VELDRYRGDYGAARVSTRRLWNIPLDAKVIGTVARLSPQKALHVLLEALPAVIREVPEVRVLIVGDGSERPRLEKLADRLGVASCVYFAGNRVDVPDQLLAMDVFVLPSLFEGLPLAILEAMAAGRPVVATAVDGVPEIVKDGVTGFLVSPGNPAQLARALVRLLRDPRTAARFGDAARQRAQDFSTDAVVDRVLDAYGVGTVRPRLPVAG
jgi:glycosyltransferase involved in cell wall biosynthesis